MAKYGSASVKIEYDDAPGGSLVDVTAHVLSIGGMTIEQITEQSNPFGTSAEAHTPVGVQRVPDIEIEGFYDDTASTGPDAVFGAPDDGPNDATRTLAVTVGARKFTMETRLVSYTVLPQNNQLTRYRATIRQAGAGAWGSA